MSPTRNDIETITTCPVCRAAFTAVRRMPMSGASQRRFVPISRMTSARSMPAIVVLKLTALSEDVS